MVETPLASVEVCHDLDQRFLREDKAWSKEALRELRAIAKLGLPLALSAASGTINNLLTSIMLGHLDTLALAATSVSTIWTSLTDVFFLSGIGQLSMFCSQAYGAGNLPLVGIWLQIYLVFTTVAGVPFMLLRFFTEPVLKAFGLHRDVAHLAGVYAVWSQVGFLLDVWYYSIKEYYAAQQITLPAAIVDAVFTVVNFGLGYVMIFQTKMGIIGAALAFTICKLLRTVTFVAFCWHRGYHKTTWPGWSCSEVCQASRWRRLLSMTLPAALGGVAEELQMQVCTLMAGELGPAETAAFALVMNLLIVGFLYSVAMGDAVGIRMSRRLGEGKPKEAAFVARIGLLASLAGNVVIAMLFLCAGSAIVKVASPDLQVQQLMMKLRWAGATTIALLGVALPLIAVLNKQGRAKVPSAILPVCCWILGFPCSYFLSRSEGVTGICEGLMIGYALATLCLFFFFFRSNWEKLTQEASERAEVQEQVT
ncbi:DTX36 [Symbiodinium sp. CCMP2592]|nr:DTX36 [Symbiodinium sp. CCMP2592]